MNKNEYNNFCEKLAEILDIEIDELSDEFPLDDSTVDSLSMLTMLSLMDEMFSIDINADDILKRKNLHGLVALINEKSK